MRIMHVCMASLAMVAVISQVSAVSITSITITGGKGENEDEPIAEEDTFSLRGQLSLDSMENWVYCSWSHIIPDEYTSDNREKKVVCGAVSPNDNGKTCTNPEGVDQTYANRITMDVSTTSCGIRISDASPQDNGIWKCNVAGSSGMGAQQSQIEIFVSNQSSVFIVNPDLEEDPTEAIVYDLKLDNPEIEATCRAYGGIPEPTFIWYFEDDRNEITTDDGIFSERIRRSSDPVLGDYIESIISFEPTIDDMCDQFSLDQPKVCEHRNKKKYWDFSFSLLCQADQGDYYINENEDARAEVIVEVVNSSSCVASSMAVILVGLVTTFLKNW